MLLVLVPLVCKMTRLVLCIPVKTSSATVASTFEPMGRYCCLCIPDTYMILKMHYVKSMILLRKDAIKTLNWLVSCTIQAPL